MEQTDQIQMPSEGLIKYSCRFIHRDIRKLIIVGTFTGLLQGASQYPAPTSNSEVHRYANGPATSGSQNVSQAQQCHNSGEDLSHIGMD